MLLVVVGVVTSACGGASPRHEALRLLFAACVDDGGGQVDEDFDLAAAGGQVLAYIGPGGHISDELLGRCLEAVSR